MTGATVRAWLRILLKYSFRDEALVLRLGNSDQRFGWKRSLGRKLNKLKQILKIDGLPAV